MSRTATPRNLSFGQRLGVRAWRTMMAVGNLVARIRRKELPGSVSEHAYGDHPDERLELLHNDRPTLIFAVRDHEPLARLTRVRGPGTHIDLIG